MEYYDGKEALRTETAVSSESPISSISAVSELILIISEYHTRSEMIPIFRTSAKSSYSVDES